jgi:hypothetical protein
MPLGNLLAGELVKIRRLLEAESAVVVFPGMPVPLKTSTTTPSPLGGWWRWKERSDGK